MLIPFFSFKGSHIFQKLRPVDQLRHLLVSCVGGESEEVERFFKLHRVQSIKITDSYFFFFFLTTPCHGLYSKASTGDF